MSDFLEVNYRLRGQKLDKEFDVSDAITWVLHFPALF